MSRNDKYPFDRTYFKNAKYQQNPIPGEATYMCATYKFYTTKVNHYKNGEDLKACIQPLSRSGLSNVTGFNQESSSNCMHDNSYMTDVSNQMGPICYDTAHHKISKEVYVHGVFLRPPVNEAPSMCPTSVFDKFGNLITICFEVRLKERDTDPGKVEIALLHLNYDKFEITDSVRLPDRQINPWDLQGDREVALAEMRKTHGGTYFFIDNQNRAIIPCSNNLIFIIPILKNGFDKENVIIINTGLHINNDKLIAVLADQEGHLWFTSRQMEIGVFKKNISTATGYDFFPIMLDINPLPKEGVFKEDEQIQNSSSVDEKGVSIVTSRRILKVGWDSTGQPVLIWESRYKNNGVHKSGHLFAGSGTTPTIFGDHLVGICNNDKQLSIEIYDNQKGENNHKIKEIILFGGKENSACENSIVAHGDFLVVGNTYGYVFPLDDNNPDNQNKTEGGLQKVRFQGEGFSPDGIPWKNDTIDIKSAVPKLSSSSGILFLFNNIIKNNIVIWKIVAIDFRSGDILFEIPIGYNRQYNNVQGTFVLGPDNSLVVCGYHGLNKITMKKPSQLD